MFSRKKEKEVKSLIGEHLGKVKETVSNMESCIRSYIEGDAAAAKESGYQTHLLEEEADNRRRSIIEKLHLGAFMPALREDLIKLVAQQDKIADRAESCCDFALMQIPEIPGEFKDKFKELLSASADTMKPYVTAAENMFVDYDVVSRNIKTVNTQEEEADKIEWHITRDLFRSQLPLARKILLRDFIFHIVCISDVIEDAADDLDILIVKYRM